MSTKAGTIGVAGLPARFTLWITAVSVLAAAALILSALALTLAGRGDPSVAGVAGTREAASIGVPVWDSGKLEAMQGRVLAEAVRADRSAALWDADKLEAMRGRVLADTIPAEGSAALWDADTLEAMQGRMLAG
jgi:anti-sigma-K factor RskA